MEDFTANLTECTDHGSALNTFKTYLNYTYGEMRIEWLKKCPVPCTQTSYTYEMKKIHTNTWLNPGYTSRNLTVTILN